MQKEVLVAQSMMILVLMGVVVWQRYRRTLKKWWQAWRAKSKRRWSLHAREPNDCQDCRLASAEAGPERSQARRRWSEVKSRRGRPKMYDSDGNACMRRGCEYYKDTDATYHALRRDGQRNKCEATDQWECGACGSKHTARLGTPLYGLKTSSERVALATHLAMKGMSVADISEVMGHSPETIRRWLARDGAHSEKLHERLFKGLVVVHIQVDELVTRVRRWAKRAWVWTAQDAQSKAWLAWLVGGRAQADAHRLVHRVKQVLAIDCVPVFTSDGLRQYFYALTAHFGQWIEQDGRRKAVWQALPVLLYGQFRKVRVGRKLKQVYTKMLCGERSRLQAVLQEIGLSGQVQTAFVERLNLTLRHLVAALRRRTWALAYNVRTLRWRVALAAAYYNFCRTHHALRVPMGQGRYRGRTPAMALGVTGHVWSVKEFITHPVY
jgi:transposase-like protein/IS1 family transposase